MPVKKQENRSFQYCSDIYPPDMVHAVLIRSPSKSGIIESIDVPELPDEYAFFSAKDIPGKKDLTVSGIQIPVFAETTVQYRGQPVGILTGPDTVTLTNLCDSIQVCVKETEPIEYNETFSDSQILAKRMVLTGDPDAVFNAADITFENTFTTHISGILDEPYSMICHMNAKNMLFFSAEQWSAELMESLAAVLSKKADEISVTKTLLNKELTNTPWILALLAAQTGIASLQLKKTVKLVLSREEQRTFYEREQPPLVRHRTALNENGEIICMQVSLILDAGMYNPYIQNILNRMVIASCGIYPAPNIKIEAYAIQTNNPPMSTSLEWCDYQPLFAAESQIYHIARAIHADQCDYRRQCCLLPANRYFFRLDRERLPAVLAAVSDKSDFFRKYSAYQTVSKTDADFTLPVRGIGCASAFKGNGFLSALTAKNRPQVELTLETENRLVVHMNVPRFRVKKTILAFIKTILNINASQVHFEKHSEIIADFDSGILLQLLEKACYDLKKQQQNEKELPLTVKKKFTIPRSAGVWDEENFTGTPYATTAWGAATVEVEIDPVLYKASIRGIWIVIDAGLVIHEKNAVSMVRRTLEKLTKELCVTRQKLPVKTQVSFIKSDAPYRDFTGIVVNTVPAAFAAAVSQALQTTITDVPVTTQTIYHAFLAGRNAQ